MYTLYYQSMGGGEASVGGLTLREALECRRQSGGTIVRSGGPEIGPDPQVREALIVSPGNRRRWGLAPLPPAVDERTSLLRQALLSDAHQDRLLLADWYEDLGDDWIIVAEVLRRGGRWDYCGALRVWVWQHEDYRADMLAPAPGFATID